MTHIIAVIVVIILASEAATGGVLEEEVFLKTLQNLQENTCARVSFLIKLQASRSGPLLKKETLALVFSCEFCQMSKSTFLTEDLWGDCFGSIIFQFSSACNISVYSSKY